ncbi:hypothetical protein N665_1188s0006 [Sinapis alba]|nr:hypothetical protein N665_1188s0006 [Sinapis alba]
METPGSNGKRNCREEDGIGSSGLGSRKNTKSFVWKHVTRLKDNYDRCKFHYCGKEMSCPTKSGTSNLKNHILGCKAFLAWKDANSFKEKSKHIVLGEQRCFQKGNLTLYRVSEDEDIYKGNCGHVCIRKAQMKKVLGQNKQRLSLTTSIWVFPYTSANYMVITAHFVDASWKLRKMIIGFKNVDDHKGSIIAKFLIDCLAEWDIRSVFCIMVDNATDNTSAMKEVQGKIHEPW